MRSACLVLVLAMLLALGASSLSIVGPAALYPQLLIAGALAALLATEWLGLRQPAPADGELAALGAGPAPARIGFGTFVLVWLAYPAVLFAFGFLLSTVIALVLSCLVLRIRRPAVIVGSSVVLSVLFAVLLRTVIYVPMPTGWLDRQVDQAIYALRRG